MKGNRALILVVLLLVFPIFTIQPEANAQSSSSITNFTVYFHPYSIVVNDPNGSLIVYEGVNALAPSGSNPAQITINSQISDQTSVLGMPVTYWAGGVMWGLRVQKDMHVSGTVSVRAYISSNFRISGLISGSGYGMGLVDIDENNNPVADFVTQAPNTIGGNVFTSAPQLYTIDTNVDHVFKAGHAIGFMVGVGATTQGFTATVYFDSTDKRSGANLPVVDTATSYNFMADSMPVSVQSNSAIANFNYAYSTKTVQFTAQLIDYTQGYCNISIPKALIRSPFLVSSGSDQITPTLSETTTEYNLYFTHIRNTNPVKVDGNPVSSTSPTPAATQPSSAAPSTSPITHSPSPTYPQTTYATPSLTPTGSPAASSSPIIPEIPTAAVLAIVAVTSILAGMYKRRHIVK